MRRMVRIVTMGAMVLMAAVGVTGAAGSAGAAAVVPPEIEVTPTSLVFGVVNQGQTSPSQDVVVTNTSGRAFGPIVIGGAVPPGEAQADVFLLDDRCTGRVLQPGGRCALTYSFRPFFVRESVAQLDIAVSEQDPPDAAAGGAVVRVTLSGVGVNPLEVSPTVIDFGAVPVGSLSPPIALRLHNPSSQPFGPLGLGGASQPPQPPFEVDEGACWGAVLAPGGSCDLIVRFRPVAPGVATATASVAVSATANRASVEFPYQLQGCGDSAAVPCAAVIPTSSPSSSSSTTTSVVETTTTWGVDTTTTTAVAGPADTVADTTTAPVDGSTPPAVPGSGVGSAGAALPRTGSGSPVPLVATGTLLLVLGAAAVLTARRRRLGV